MKQETLKKIVELAEGFAYERIYDPTGKETARIVLINKTGIWCIIDIIERWEYYPLILRRAVEGWNDIEAREIILTMEFVSVSNKPIDPDDYWHHEYTKTEYLTPQEQAIEACLIELLEKPRSKPC